MSLGCQCGPCRDDRADARCEASLIKNDIHSNTRAGLWICGGACPWIEGNSLHDGKGAGILVSEGGRGVIYANTLERHAKTELQVCDEGTWPVVESNTIAESAGGGVLVSRSAGGLFHQNTIRANHAAGATRRDRIGAPREEHDSGRARLRCCCARVLPVSDNIVKGNGKANAIIYGEHTRPTLLRNTIERSEQAGIYLYAKACATIEANEVRGNQGPNLLVTEGSDPIIHRNVIHSGEDAGILVHLEGKGTITSNNVYNQRTFGVVVLKGGTSLIRTNWLHGKRQGGVLVDEGGRCELAENTIEGNTKAGVTLRGACSPHIHHNRIFDGRDSGIHAMDGAGGLIEENDIHSNDHSGLGVESGAAPTVRRNKIHDGKQVGAFFFDGGLGTFEENEVWGNADAGVQIIEAADPVVRNNLLRKQQTPDGKAKVFLAPGERAPEAAHAKAPTNGGDTGHKDLAPLWIHSGGLGTIEANEITQSDWHGVIIARWRNQRFARTEFMQIAVRVFMQDGAAPLLIENDVFKNWVGVEVIEHAEPTLRGNKIHHNRLNGVQVYKTLRVREENEIAFNMKANVRIWKLGDPIV